MAAPPWVGETDTTVELDSATGLAAISIGDSDSTGFAGHPAITKKAEKMSRLTAIFKVTSSGLYCYGRVAGLKSFLGYLRKLLFFPINSTVVLQIWGLPIHSIRITLSIHISWQNYLNLSKKCCIMDMPILNTSSKAKVIGGSHAHPLSDSVRITLGTGKGIPLLQVYRLMPSILPIENATHYTALPGNINFVGRYPSPGRAQEVPISHNVEKS